MEWTLKRNVTENDYDNLLRANAYLLRSLEQMKCAESRIVRDHVKDTMSCAKRMIAGR